MNQILSNRPLVAAFCAAMFAQFLKPFLLFPLERKFDYRLFFSTGGMPSSHTAGVVALCTSLLIVEGVQSYYFAIAFTFASIVIHDAMGIRRAAGKQAEIINEWSRLLTQIHNDGEFTPENLKTMLGHSFTQVVGGLVIGISSGLIFTYIL